MNDLSILQEIEKQFYIDLPKCKNLNWNINIGYTLNERGNVDGIKLGNCKIIHLKKIILLLKKLPELIKLDLSNNLIEDFSALNKLTKLEHLILKNNKIKFIYSLEKFHNLKSLDLEQNNIIQIIIFKNMPNLIELNLGSNNLFNISTLSNLKNLTILSIDNNKFSNIEVLRLFFHLRFLKLCKNKIKNISPLKNLSNLENLYLWENLIEDITPLKELKNLKTLYLGKNPIEVIPEWITDFDMEIKWGEQTMDNSGEITFFNNLIKTPPIEILKQGKETIKRYFNKVKLEGIDYIYEAKLTLVGEGSAGKTSLQVRLMNPSTSLPKKDKRTRGIKIYDWKFKKIKTKEHVAHIWDFGGQDVYYPVHRFFLTENSVFVLLASTRQTNHNFDYWIPTIYQFGGKSPIILGQTCNDGNKIPWNDLDYYIGNSNFNIIKTQSIPYYEINLPKRNEGLAKIKQVIINQIISLPHYGKGVPKSWVPVREIIFVLSKKNACISYEKFVEICKKSNSESFARNEDIRDCAKFLHSVGIILWYYDIDELKDWVILQPEWAMNAVYKIIDDDEIQGPKRRGTIFAKDFLRLWDDECYIDKHNILKNMLEVFKIAFPKKHKKEDYIIPARLISMPNESRWLDNEPYLRLEYKYEFMPKGMVNQISAELSRYVSNDSEVWNNAVNFNLGGNEAQCQVEEDFYNRKIRIKAKGKDARGLIMLVMDALSNITDEYKGVIPEIFIPCTCDNCKQLKRPTMFLYTDLVRWSNLKDAAVCNESGLTLSIETLLFNVGLLDSAKYSRNINNKKTIKIFLASSEELKEDRKEFEIYINRLNKLFEKKGKFFELNIWEDFIDSMSKTGLQEKYNNAVKKSDIFVSLFFTKVGKFTKEEFEIAFGQFKKSNKPLVYTYFKDSNISTGKLTTEIETLFAFKDKLKELKHYPTIYKNIDDLLNQFRSQLDKVLDNI